MDRTLQTKYGRTVVVSCRPITVVQYVPNNRRNKHRMGCNNRRIPLCSFCRLLGRFDAANWAKGDLCYR
jgi:hypothetical protein